MADINLTSEQRANLNAFAVWASEQNSSSGGRTLADVSDQLLNKPGVASTFEVLGIDTTPPPGLNEQQAREWDAAVSSLGNLQFEVGYRNPNDISDAVQDALEYQVKCLDALRNDFATLASPSASPDAKTNAQLRIKKFSTQFVGDIEDSDSVLQGYRRNGDSYFQGTKAIENFTPEERAAAWLDVAGQTQLDPEDFTVGGELRAAADDRIASLNPQPARSGIPVVSKTRPTRQSAAVGSKQPMSTSDYQAAIEAARAERGGMTPQDYAAALAREESARQSAGPINYGDIPSVERVTLDPIPDLGPMNYTNPIVQAKAAQIGDLGSVNRNVQYSSMPTAQAAQVQGPSERRVGSDEMIDDAAIRMITSRWEDPEYFTDIDPRGIDAMNSSLGYFGDLVESEGLDAVSQAHYNRMTGEAEQRRRSTLEAAIQELESRGMGTSGAEFQAQIQGSGQSMKAMYDAALESKALAQQRKDAAAQQQAMVGEAVRKLQFGEAATMEEALRQVGMARGELEFARQQENTATLTGTRESAQRFREAEAVQNAIHQQEANIQNMKEQAAELRAQNRFQEAASLEEYVQRAQAQVEQAKMQNQANIQNMISANTEYGSRNRSMEEGVLQTQKLGAQKNIAQGEIDTRANIADAANRATEIGSRNRFKEGEYSAGQDMIVNGIIGDAATRVGIASGNSGIIGGAYSGYGTGMTGADQHAIELAKLDLAKQGTPEPWERYVATGGKIVGTGGKVATQF